MAPIDDDARRAHRLLRDLIELEPDVRMSLRVALDDVAEPAAEGRDLDLLALDECLSRLAELDARQATIVEYLYFGGLTLDEIADEMGLGSRTVDREWACARAWLLRELAGRGAARDAD